MKREHRDSGSRAEWQNARGKLINRDSLHKLQSTTEEVLFKHETRFKP